jgi:translation initiation factor IF-2
MLGWFQRRSKRSDNSDNISAPASVKDRWLTKYRKYYLGKITHHYPKIKVGIILVEKGELCVGDVIYVRGTTTFFKQKIGSIEYKHRKVKRVGKGFEVGVRITARVRAGDDVYMIPPTST